MRILSVKNEKKRRCDDLLPAADFMRCTNDIAKSRQVNIVREIFGMRMFRP